MTLKYSLIALAPLLSFSIAVSEPRDSTGIRHTDIQNVASHAGQLDTDGILSPGEIRNPNIDYDRAQRYGESRGDYRYNNPINDAAADRDKDLKEADRYRYDRSRHRYYYDDDDYYADDYKPYKNRSWWNW